MSRNIYCAVEAYDEETKKWYGTDCNFVNLCTRDFVGNPDCFNYIFTGLDRVPEPNIYNPKEQSDLVKSYVDKKEDIGGSQCQVYYGFVYYKMEEVQKLIDMFAREFYCRTKFKELQKNNDLQAKAEVLDFVKQGLENNTDNATLKRLIMNAENEINSYYDPNELEDTYQSIRYILQDLVGIYLKMKNSYFDTKTNKIVDYDSADFNDYDRWKLVEEMPMRVVFYFSC